MNAFQSRTLRLTAPIIVSTLLCGMLFGGPLAARGQENSPIGRDGARPRHTLSVSGRATMRVKPEKAEITIGVVTENKSSQAAAKSNAASSQEVQAALRKAGIDNKDIQTVNYTVEPIYSQPPFGKGGAPQLTGFRVYNQVRVTTHKLDSLGDILDAVTAAGSNSVENISFGLDDESAAQNMAFERAVADARRRADRIAKAAGTAIVGIYEISDNTANNGGPRPMMMGMARAAGPSTPIAPGELTIETTVSIVYEISGQLAANR